MESVVNLLYLTSGVMFIITLRMLTSPRTARAGNWVGAAGMLVAIVATLLYQHATTYTWIILGLAIGAVIGAVMAFTVPMTAMPETVGALNGSGGLAAALVVIAEFYRPSFQHSPDQAVIAGISTLIGWVTFTGSIVAVGKLREVAFSGRPVTFWLQNWLNMLLAAASAGLIIAMGILPQHESLLPILIGVSCLLGLLMLIPIGGADMPVAIAIMNSGAGLSAAAAGFLLRNSGLIIAGTLVGASGITLARLMSIAMNRSLRNVLFGAFGKVSPTMLAEMGKRTARRYSAEDAKIVLEDAARVVIIPGYGMAVAQAQHVLRELADILEKRGVTVFYAIHPVAGRMPGHMNVMLADANVPYSQLLDLDQGNAELEQADVALVVGANDVVNPAARDDPRSPIAGMPILNADHARTVMVIKRSLSPGFAGIDNELFYMDKTMMLFDDAKKMLTELVTLMKG